jgi:hypothetical protein
MGQNLGGPPNGLVALARAQATMGDDVAILSCADCNGKMLIAPGQYRHLNVLEPCLTGRLTWSQRVKRRVDELVPAAQIVHMHGSWPYHLVAARAARRSNIPTAIGNDYGFERVVARQVQALGGPGDVAVAISTSGHFPNLLPELAVGAVVQQVLRHNDRARKHRVPAQARVHLAVFSVAT